MHQSPCVSLRLGFVLAALATLTLLSGLPVSSCQPFSRKIS